MRKALIIAALSCITATAQVSVTFSPVSLIATRKVFGAGRQVGYWTVGVCNDSAAALTVPRERLLAAAPALRPLPNTLAEDVIGRQVASDPKSIIGAQGDQILSLASAGTAIGGFATGSQTTQIIGLSMSGLQFVFRLLKQQAPDATPYYSSLLPDTITLAPLACGTYGLVSGLVHQASPVQASITLPGMVSLPASIQVPR